MDVRLVATVDPGKEPRGRAAEEAMEDVALSSAREALSRMPLVKLVKVEHYVDHDLTLIHEFGIPVDVGLPESVRVSSDGSWCYPSNGHWTNSGPDFPSLVQFVLSELAGVD